MDFPIIYGVALGKRNEKLLKTGSWTLGVTLL